MSRYCAILFFIAVSFMTSRSQNLSFGRLPDELSISNLPVRTMLQDSKGFLWLGTWNGLFRYDGYSLSKFKVSANLQSENKGSKIVALKEDSEGNIWVVTQNTGLYRFDRRTEVFTTFQHDEKDDKTIASNQVYAVFEDNKKRIWVGTKYGIDLFENGVFKHFKQTPLIKLEVQSITQARNGSLWCATSYGVFNCFDAPDGTLITQYYDMEQPNTPVTNISYSENFCFTILEDPTQDNLIWVSTKVGLKKLDASKNIRFSFKSSPDGLTDNTIYTMLFPSASNGNYLWLGTENGLNRYNTVSNTFERFFADLDDENSLRNNTILSLLEDRSGLLWVGTNKGVNKLNLKKKAFEKIFTKGENIVSDLISHKNSLWVATYGKGIFEIPLNGRKDISRRLQVPNMEGYIYAIHIDTQDILWAATRGGGIYKIPLSTPHKYAQFNQMNRLSSSYIMTVFEDSQHYLWFGTWSGELIRYNRSTDSFTNIKILPNNPFAVGEYPIVQFFEFKNKQNEHILWLGMRGGGIMEVALNDKSDIIKINKVYQNNPQNAQSLSNNFINCFLKDNSGRIWVGTEEGFNQWDSENGTFKSYSTSDGLPDENIQAIAQDDKQNFWLTTNKGISKVSFDKKGQIICRNFDEKDGLPSNYFQPASVCKINDKLLLFGSTNGIAAFYPDDIKDNETAPMVSLVDFKLFNQSIKVGETKNGRSLLPLSISDIKTIELAYNDNAFSLEFAALHFDEPNKNRYAYRLIGFNSNWIYVNANERTAHYTNLPHGNYIFEVKAANNDGIWSKDTARVQIVVHPPFWLTWWAYLFYAACIGGAIWLYRRTILVRENLKNQVKMETFKREQSEEMSQMKVRFFTNVSHELRTPLTLILSPLEELIKKEDVTPSVHDTYDLMQRNATRLFNLITELLDFRKTEAGLMTLQVVETDIVKYLTNITIAFRDLARQRHIDFSFITTAENLKVWFDRNQMEKVFFNILSNAFKYTDDGGKVTVKLDMDEQRNAVISIEDSGLGIAADELPHIFEEFYRGKMPVEGKHRQGTGIGLALTKNIIDLHKSKITVESEAGKGSKFTISMPLGNEHFEPKFVDYDFKSSEDITFYPAPNDFPVEQIAATPPQYSADLASEKANKPLVLIVEDNPDIRTFIRMSLHPFYQIEEAENGALGLEKAQQFIPDLIISDVIMPEMDGLELCTHIKALEYTCHIPLILLTARSSQLYQIEGYETGADDYVTKPFNMTLLLTRVKNLLENRERIQRRFEKNFTQNTGFEVKPTELNITHLDKVFLEKCIELVEKNLEDSDYSVEQMSSALFMSRMQVYRKLKALTGDTPNHFIRIIRLKRAAQLLEKGYTVAETTYKVGFQDLKYFRECFKKQFGVNPSEFVKV